MSSSAASGTHDPPRPYAPAKVIIDTDPGIDDINALLLALASPPEEIQVLLISATYGNVDVKNCTRNIVALFHIIEREREWRISQGLPPGYDSLDHHKPIVAIGPSEPLGEQQRMADYFHGYDGLGGIHDTHAHLFSHDPWEDLFDLPPPESDISSAARQTTNTARPNPKLFTPSKRPSHLEILSVLASNPANTISVIAIGPLTNIALAAAEDPATLCRAKELIIMGGALAEPGNITPLAEFNVYADAFAAARVFALTSPLPASTMPPKPPISQDGSEHSKRLRDLPDYPPALELGERRLNIVLFPLDCTEQHPVFRKDYLARIDSVLKQGSPLAEWHSAFMRHSFRTMEDLHKGHADDTTFVVLHDPLCVWWALDTARKGLSSSSSPSPRSTTATAASNSTSAANAPTDLSLNATTNSAQTMSNDKQATTSAILHTSHNRANEEEDDQQWHFNTQHPTWTLSSGLDIRVESAGQWSRGACIVDQRDRKKQIEAQEIAETLAARKGDEGAWLSDKRGNRVRTVTGTPGGKTFVELLWQRIFAL